MRMRTGLIAVGLVTALFAVPKTTWAAAITVTTTADDMANNGNCTLREAIQAANTNTVVDACSAGSASGTDIITVGTGTYNITIAGAGEDSNATGDFDIHSNIEINGAGMKSTVINGNQLDRIFDIFAGAFLDLRNVTVQNGTVTNDVGGGIANSGDMDFQNVIVLNNSASGMSSAGGGIYNDGTMAMNSSVVKGNTVTSGSGASDIASGGGIENDAGTTWILTSTIESNAVIATGSSGAYAYGAGISNFATLKVDISTISSNAVTGGDSGGISNALTGVATIRDTTIAMNTADLGTGGIMNDPGGTVNILNTLLGRNVGGIAPDCVGTLTSQGYNLVDFITGCTISGITTGNITNQDPQIFSLEDNNAQMRTHALLTGSPAIDAGHCTTFQQDERSVFYQVGKAGGSGACDIGSYELDITPPTASSLSAPYFQNIAKTSASFSFIASEISTVSVSGSCVVAPTLIGSGLNILTFPTTVDKTYNDCFLSIRDVAGTSNFPYHLTSFTLDRSAPTVTLVSAIASPTNSPTATIRSSEFGMLTLTGCFSTYSAISPNTDLILPLTGFTEGSNRQCSVTVTDTSGNTSSPLSLGTFTYDITPPSIAFKGDGKLYQGATAIDNLSGVNANGVVVTNYTGGLNGAYDGKKYGLYSVRYDATDNAGNAATPLYRMVVVRPKVETVSVKNNAFTITKPNGKKLTITPFGKNNSVAFIVQKVTFNPGVDATYMAMMIGPTKNWSTKIYTIQGAEQHVFTSTAGKILKTLTLPSSITAKGINWTSAFDDSNGKFFVAITPKSGSDVPQVLTIQPTYSGWVKLTTKTKATNGNVLVKFLSLDGNGQRIVTVTGKAVRIWKTDSSGQLFTQDTVTKTGRFTVTKGIITQYAPTLLSTNIVPSSVAGTGSITWKFDKPVTLTWEYGQTTKYGTSVRKKTASATQTIPFVLHANTYYQYRFTACTKGVAASIGCMTSANQYFKTL